MNKSRTFGVTDRSQELKHVQNYQLQLVLCALGVNTVSDHRKVLAIHVADHLHEQQPTKESLLHSVTAPRWNPSDRKCRTDLLFRHTILQELARSFQQQNYLLTKYVNRLLGPIQHNIHCRSFQILLPVLTTKQATTEKCIKILT